MGDRACDRYALSIREFLTEVSRALREAPDAPWRLAAREARSHSELEALKVPLPDWDDFVPTTVFLTPPRDPEARISHDIDHEPAKFVTGIKIVEEERRYGATRTQKVSVRTYLAPTALASEVHHRTAQFERSAHGARLRARNWMEDTFDTLTSRERRRMKFIPPDERVALAAVTVAGDRPVVSFAPDSAWPCHPLVNEVARRLGCRFVRRPLAEIPFQIRRHIRCVQYRVPSPAELSRGQPD